MKEFKINQFITLKLEEKRTIIYVNNRQFKQCKFLMLNINVNEIQELEDIESIDEAEDKLDKSLEKNRNYYDRNYYNNNNNFNITPEEEFWAHCSNLEAWAENNYDTRILHRDLSFPLLEELSNAGDLTAKKTFKEEIVKRIRSGHIKTAWFLLGEQKYLSRIKFTKEERSLIFLNNNKKLKDKINLTLEKLSFEELGRGLELTLLDILRKYGDPEAEKILKNNIIEVYESGIIKFIDGYVLNDWFDIFNFKELISLIFESKSPMTKKFLKILEENNTSTNSVIKTLKRLNELNQKATKTVLIEDLLNHGVNYPIEESIEDYILEAFRFSEENPNSL